MNGKPATCNLEPAAGGAMLRAPMDWKRVAGRVWAAQSRADLNERPRLLLAWIIRGTVECGRTQLLVPDFGELFAMLHITANHRKEVCQVLQKAMICRFDRVHEGWQVTLFTDASRWQCAWYHAEDAKARWLERLNALPGQCQGDLLEPEPCLVKAMAEVAVEAVSSPLSVVSSRGGEPPRAITSHFGKSPVPKMGTGEPPVAFARALRSLEVKSFSKPSKLGSALSAGGFKGGESTPHPQPLSPVEAERVAPRKAGKGGVDVEGLKQALYGVESTNEVVAVAGMRLILGNEVFENDGGKWRNRWRRDRARTQEVFAAMVEYLGRKEIGSRGGFAEWLWGGACGTKTG